MKMEIQDRHSNLVKKRKSNPQYIWSLHHMGSLIVEILGNNKWVFFFLRALLLVKADLFNQINFVGSHLAIEIQVSRKRHPDFWRRGLFPLGIKSTSPNWATTHSMLFPFRRSMTLKHVAPAGFESKPFSLLGGNYLTIKPPTHHNNKWTINW